MSSIQKPSLDQELATALLAGSNVVAAPIDILRFAIDRLKTIKNKEEESKVPEFPTLKGTILDIRNWFIDYHRRVLVFGAIQSESIEKITQKFFEKTLTPLNCFQVGGAIQDIFSNRLASIARIITFGAIQFFHAVPYLVIGALVSGTILIYQTSPIALVALIAGGIFLIQIVQNYMLAKGLERATYLFERESERMAVQLDVNNFLEASRVAQLTKGGLDQVAEYLTTSTPYKVATFPFALVAWPFQKVASYWTGETPPKEKTPDSDKKDKI